MKIEKTKEMVRCRLRNMFSILTIFVDFLATKPTKIPISLSKLISIFPYVARFARTYSKSETFLSDCQTQ